jgi:hypothetical protein
MDLGLSALRQKDATVLWRVPPLRPSPVLFLRDARPSSPDDAARRRGRSIGEQGSERTWRAPSVAPSYSLVRYRARDRCAGFCWRCKC